MVWRAVRQKRSPFSFSEDIETGPGDILSLTQIGLTAALQGLKMKEHDP
jgi:hypothetical protein